MYEAYEGVWVLVIGLPTCMVADWLFEDLWTQERRVGRPVNLARLNREKNVLRHTADVALIDLKDN